MNAIEDILGWVLIAKNKKLQLIGRKKKVPKGGRNDKKRLIYNKISVIWLDAAYESASTIKSLARIQEDLEARELISRHRGSHSQSLGIFGPLHIT